MIKIAASDSSAADKAAANVVCGPANAQNEINAAMNAGDLHLFFFNGNYAIDAPVDIRDGCVLEGDTVHGVTFNCNNPLSVFRTSAPAARHEFVLLDSLSVVPGSHDDLACDLRGFTRSQFTRLNIAGFSIGVWFGGDLPVYDSCWTNALSRFHIGNCLVGVRLSGVGPNGGSTANNIMLLEGEIICRDAAGGRAIDAVDSQLIVHLCDIGYGDASAGIVLGANSPNARIIDSRFEWDAQDASVYPIMVETGSYYHYVAGNVYSNGCSRPNLHDANLPGGRYIQIDDFPRSAAFPEGFVDFNIDVSFRRSPSFPAGAFARGDTSPVLDAPAAAIAAAAGNGAAVSIAGTNLSGLLTLTTGSDPAAGEVAKIFWSTVKPSSNYAVVLTAANASAAAAMSRLYVDEAAATASVASVVASVALEPSTTYKFSYVVLSY